LIKNAFPITLNLTIVALLLATIIGLILGIAAARRRDGVAAKFVNAYSSVALAIPLFLVGMLLVWLFSLHLHVLPSSGYTSLLSSPSEYLRHMILPTVTLAFYGSGIMVRFVAAAMNETLGQDYIWTARAKGIRESAVVRRHALRNALIPITTVLGLQLGVMLGGTVITEAVFNLPGMGQLLLSSVERRDYPVVQAEVLYIVLVVAAINIFVDVLYGVLDPRVRR
jgi:peptide/nickel transport system permease protein